MTYRLLVAVKLSRQIVLESDVGLMLRRELALLPESSVVFLSVFESELLSKTAAVPLPDVTIELVMLLLLLPLRYKPAATSAVAFEAVIAV